MRSGLFVSVLAGVLVVITLGQGVALPWQPSCGLVDWQGRVLVQGSPSTVSQAIEGAQGDIETALQNGPNLTCRIAAEAPTNVLKERPLGLTPRAEILRAQVRDEFGQIPDGGFGPEQVLNGRQAGGAHSMGRAIDYFFEPYESAQAQARGWHLANWLVANAARLGVRTVIYRDMIWTARRSSQGWRDYRYSGSNPDNPTNRHLDHVHVDVA